MILNTTLLRQNSSGVPMRLGPTSYSTSPSGLLNEEFSPASRPLPNALPLPRESEWEADKIYDEDPPSCIPYLIEWRVTVNNKVVVKN